MNHKLDILINAEFNLSDTSLLEFEEISDEEIQALLITEKSPTIR
jgi:hypothetical protein